MNIEELRQYRIRCGISMYALAKKMGIDDAQIRNTELRIGKNYNCSEEWKKRYLNAMYEIMGERMEKQNNKKKKGE